MRWRTPKERMAVIKAEGGMAMGPVRLGLRGEERREKAGQAPWKR